MYPKLPSSSSSKKKKSVVGGAAAASMNANSSATAAAQSNKRDIRGSDDDNEILTVTGVQLKSLISQYASQAVKDEIARVLSELTKHQ